MSKIVKKVVIYFSFILSSSLLANEGDVLRMVKNQLWYQGVKLNTNIHVYKKNETKLRNKNKSKIIELNWALSKINHSLNN